MTSNMSCQTALKRGADHLGLFLKVALGTIGDERFGIESRLHITARQNGAYPEGVSLALAVAAIEVRTCDAIGTWTRAFLGYISTDTRFGADRAGTGNGE